MFKYYIWSQDRAGIYIGYPATAETLGPFDRIHLQHDTPKRECDAER
jgi:hypothetical protein